MVSATTAVPRYGLPRVDGDVLAVTGDGAGGWFIGGRFQSAPLEPWPHPTRRRDHPDHAGARERRHRRRRQARIARAIDGPGSQFTEGPSRPVFALAISGDFVFAGGDFDLVNGVRRSGLAKIDRTTGALVAEWNAQALSAGGAANGRVLALNGTDILLGGDFGTLAGLARPGAARVSRAGTSSPGAVRSWNPRAGFTCGSGFECLGVSALFASGEDVYLGGGFSHVGGADRAGLAAIDLTTGEATSWNAALEGGARSVAALTVRDTTLYVAGDFTSAGGQPRAGLAGLSTAGAAPTGWRPAPLAVAPPPGLLSGPAGIYLLGRETAMGDAAVPAVATDPVTGAAAPWAPAVAGTAFIVPAERGIRAAATFGDTLFLGGSFATLGGQARPQIGSVSATTGAVTGWAPGGVGFGTVRALAVRPIDAGVRLAYIGGDFTQVAGRGELGSPRFPERPVAGVRAVPAGYRWGLSPEGTPPRGRDRPPAGHRRRRRAGPRRTRRATPLPDHPGRGWRSSGRAGACQ